MALSQCVSASCILAPDHRSITYTCWHSDMLGIALCCKEEVCWRSRHSRFPLLLYLHGVTCHEPTVRPLAERHINLMVHVLKYKSLTFLGSVSPAFFLKDC